jgi:peptidoglycan/LPS O-acetylase OafA/YrhL
MFKRLLLLNGISILGVILFHSAGWGFVALYFWAHRYLSPEALLLYDPSAQPAYYVLRLVEQLIIFCIPAFLFVSGVFIAITAGRKQKTVGWNLVGIRLRDLLIPYLIWSLLLLGLMAAEGITYSPSDYLAILATGRANPAYYYVILLCQFYLLSPLLVPLARERPWLLLVAAGIIQTAVQLLYYPALLDFSVGPFDPLVDLTPKWFFAARIFWFSVGIVAGFRLKELEQLIVGWKRPLLITTLLLLPLGVLEWELMLRLSGEPWLDHRETLLDTVYAALFILTFLAYHRSPLPASNTVSDLGVKSFGIYIVHSPVMEYAARAIYHLAPALLAYQLFLQPFLIILGLGIPLLLMAMVHRTPVRHYYKYAFG